MTKKGNGIDEKRFTELAAQSLCAHGRVKSEQICKETGLTSSAVRNRVHRRRKEIEEEAQRINDLLIETLGDKAETVLGALDEEKISKAGLRDLCISFGVLMDKRATLLGRDFGTGRMPNYKVRFSQRTPDGTERSVEVQQEGGQVDTPIEE